MSTAGQILTDASAWPHQLCLLCTTSGRTDICLLVQKIRIYQDLVQSVLLYATEPWTPRATDIKALEAFHMKCQRQLLQISWQQFIRNDEVAATTALPSISDSPAAVVAPSSVTSRDYHTTSRRTRPSTATSTCLLADHPTTSGNAARADTESDGSTRSGKTTEFPRRVLWRRATSRGHQVARLRPSLATR